MLAYAARKHFPAAEKTARVLAVLETAAAAAIALGAATQIAALAGAIIIGAWLASARLRPVSKGAAFLSLVMCISLIITGAGALAIDLPL